MNLIDLALEKGLEPKKTSSHGGGEFHSACPACGGQDRFALWPNAHANKCMGRYWCRQCNIKGDAIQFCRDFLNLSWNEIHQKLNIPHNEFQIFRTESRIPEKKYKVSLNPSELWQQKANKFVDWSHSNLLRNVEMLAYVQNRGLTLKTIKQFKIGFNPGEYISGTWKDFLRPREEWGLSLETKEDGTPKPLKLHIGIIIPTFQDEKIIKIKVRRTNYEKEMKYYQKALELGKNPKYTPSKYLSISGSKESPSLYGNISLSAGIVIESELDGILIQQFAADLVYSISLGGNRKPIDFHTNQILQRSSLILLSPDVDMGGSSMMRLKEEYQNSKLWSAPKGKSAGDAYKDYGIDLRQWILQGLPFSLRSDSKSE